MNILQCTADILKLKIKAVFFGLLTTHTMTGKQNSSVATATVPGDAERIQNQSAKPSVENRSQANVSSTLPNHSPPARMIEGTQAIVSTL